MTNDQAQDQDLDELTNFANWWCQHRYLRPPFDSTVVTFDDNVVGTTLYREGQYQVQLFTVKPHTEIVDHIHPNVDSYEVYVGGQIEFRLHGEKITRFDTQVEANGIVSEFGKMIRVLPTSSHGGTFGQMGGCFLSIQHWTNPNVPPSSVHMDWGFMDSADTARNHAIDS